MKIEFKGGEDAIEHAKRQLSEEPTLEFFFLFIFFDALNA